MMPLYQALILLSALFPLFRLWRGPNPWDRIAGANGVNVRVALSLALAGLWWEQPVLLDVALGYAMLGFLGTVLLARFWERGEG